MCHHGARFTMILSCFAMLLRWHQQLASIFPTRSQEVLATYIVPLLCAARFCAWPLVSCCIWLSAGLLPLDGAPGPSCRGRPPWGFSFALRRRQPSAVAPTIAPTALPLVTVCVIADSVTALACTADGLAAIGGASATDVRPLTRHLGRHRTDRMLADLPIREIRHAFGCCYRFKAMVADARRSDHSRGLHV